MAPAITVVGLMCGTSLDGADVAWVRGGRLLHFTTHPMWPSLRRRLRPLLAGEAVTVEEVAAAEVAVARWFVDAVRRSGVRDRPDLVAAHGITAAHRPERGYSLQLGDLATLARGLACTTVGRFRSADVAAGGQGAPLAPLFHRHLFGHSEEPRLVLNLGGIANLSELPADGPARGYDLGPCNLLLDPLYQRATGSPGFDRDGALAATGQPLDAVVATQLAHPYLCQPPPKSTGREAFGPPFVDPFAEACGAAGATGGDALATAGRFIAAMVADHLRRAPQPANGWRRLILCGGGSRNRTLTAAIEAAVTPIVVESSATHGIDPDAVEAVGFAHLGLACLRGDGQPMEPITGGPGHPILGELQPGPNYRQLRDRLPSAAHPAEAARGAAGERGPGAWPGGPRVGASSCSRTAPQARS